MPTPTNDDDGFRRLRDLQRRMTETAGRARAGGSLDELLTDADLMDVLDAIDAALAAKVALHGVGRIVDEARGGSANGGD
ncbi:MAG: hypothetical protein ACU85V_00245 [Gammaproteobacteria bacterium]